MGAFSLDSGGKDAALVVWLDPGVYSAIVTDASNALKGTTKVDLDGHVSKQAMRIVPVPDHLLVETESAVSGSGFSDKVEDGTHIAKFRDQLIATPYFSDKTEITRLSQVRSSDYAIEFTLRLALTDTAALP